jgi:23S rRNA (adenine2503-C2)-methyltransferase
VSRFLVDLSPSEIVELATGLGEKPYRARQILNRVYKHYAWTWDEMPELPAGLRGRLAAALPVHGLEEKHLQVSADGTSKGLFRLLDGKTVEAALMPQRGRATVCVSSQVGCNVGCPFCATGQQGYERNLTAGEIVDQVLYFARYLKDGRAGEGAPARVTNVVFMGMGEPLASYEEVMRAVGALNAPERFGLGARNITISTAGLAPQIRQLGEEPLQVGLAVSLHAGTDALRDRLVPVNRTYPLAELMAACRDYFKSSGRRVSFEYVLFKGVNDAPKEARALAALLKGMNCHVNLIPANTTGNRGYRPPDPAVVSAFMAELRSHHITTTLRHSRGGDIDAGCGQLRSRLAAAAAKG